MKKVKDLNSDEAAHLARDIYLDVGVVPTVRQLAFYAMLQHEKPGPYFKYLLLFLARLSCEEHDDLNLDMAVLEYASTIIPEAPDSADSESISRRLIINRLEVYVPIGEVPAPDVTPLTDASKFKLDRERYDATLLKATNGTGNLDVAWKAYRISTGLAAGAIKYPANGNTSISLFDLGENYTFTDQYLSILEQEELKLS